MEKEPENDPEINKQEANGPDESGKKKGIHNNALFAASMGRAATAPVDPHDTSGLAQTGTNTSYEGAIASGGGGSAGSGFTSGQSGVETSISSTSDYGQTIMGKTMNASDKQADESIDEINEQRSNDMH